MKKISHTSRNLRKPQSLIVRTGAHCPINGLWKPLDSSGEALFVFEGSIMPTHNGGSTEWMLVDAKRRIAEGATW